MTNDLLKLLRLTRQIEDELINRLAIIARDASLKEDQSPSVETSRRRHDRDIKRRDQITQSSKKINSLRAAMGT